MFFRLIQERPGKPWIWKPVVVLHVMSGNNNLGSKFLQKQVSFLNYGNRCHTGKANDGQ